MADQTDNPGMAERFQPLAEALEDQEETILAELNGAQGPSQDVGGYYMPDQKLAGAAMCPSATLNGIIETL